VEARGKGIRLQHLVPIPSGRDLEEINRALLERLDASVDDRFAADRGGMLPLPPHAFRARATHLPSVSRRSLITVEGAIYSVPCTWAGLDVTAHVGADDVEVVGPTGIVVVHPRMRLGAAVHRLPALSGPSWPASLRRSVRWPPNWCAIWALHSMQPGGFSSTGDGPKQAARIFAKVLGHVETRGLALVAQALQGALLREEPMPPGTGPTCATRAPAGHSGAAVQPQSGGDLVRMCG
jgi:hypothetical protein